MKYIKLLIIGLVCFISNIVVCNAASLSLSSSQSSSKIVVGNTVTYTVKLSAGNKLGVVVYHINYDSSKLTYVSGSKVKDAVTFTNGEKVTTYTFKFKAKTSGTANFSYVIDEAIDFDGNVYSGSKSTSRSVSIITQAQLEASYSKDNYLKRLNVDGYDIKFDKNTTSYSLEVENEVTSVNITGAVNDSKSSVKGLGKHDVVEGLNKINIDVTAQNGSTRTYTININVKELTPIVVELDGKKYNVVRKENLLEKPNTQYNESTVIIDEEEVPSLFNEITNVNLVGLKDEEGNINLYIYKDNNYTLYVEYALDSLIVTEAVVDIPEGYNETNLTINNKNIKAYQKDGGDYYLFGATNIENGKTNLYQYDKKENTIQIFNESLLNESKKLKEDNQLYLYIILGLGILLIITYIVLIVTKVGNKKNVSKKNKKKDNFDFEEKEEFDSKEEFDYTDNKVTNKNHNKKNKKK